MKTIWRKSFGIPVKYELLEIDLDSIKVRVIGHFATRWIDINEVMNISTRQINPPIPSKNYDWEATKSDYDEGDIIGYGKTELEAIEDLINQEINKNN